MIFQETFVILRYLVLNSIDQHFLEDIEFEDQKRFLAGEPGRLAILHGWGAGLAGWALVVAEIK
jgi:hypothetical protein